MRLPRFLLGPATLLCFGAAVLLLGGCASLPSSHRTAADTPARAASIQKVVVLPLDVEVSELSAGGMTEKRDDWTRLVTDNLVNGITRLTPFQTMAARDELSADELRDVQVLFQTITVNQILHSMYGPGLLTSLHGPLTYQLGSLETLAQRHDADAVVVMFVRDDYATSGRKAVAVVGALTGIPVRTGVTLSSAALVHRDGTLLWMNYLGVNRGDLRTQDDADATVSELFTHLPALPNR